MGIYEPYLSLAEGYHRKILSVPRARFVVEKSQLPCGASKRPGSGKLPWYIVTLYNLHKAHLKYCYL